LPRCKDISIWISEADDSNRMIYPRRVVAPPPNPDLPDEVATDYQEAALILGDSPRGSAALLRLAIQKLCLTLGEDASNLNDAIGNLVRRGLLPLVQRALDIVRVIGNEAVHPGTIDLRDDRETAFELFGLVNVIAEQMITQPRNVQELYDKLPQEKREAIERRDQSAEQPEQTV
jgi:hypothetical protein